MTREAPEIVERELQLFQSTSKELDAQVEIARQQLNQRNEELKEAITNRDQLTKRHDLLQKELDVTGPMVNTGAVSQVELLRLERDVIQTRGERDQVLSQIDRIQASIAEARRKIQEVELTFYNRIRRELSETLAKLNSLTEEKTALADRVHHADITSPVKGTVKRLFFNTLGGVVQQGKEIIEIVPADDTLVLEVKISPKDIAFLNPKQKAQVRFTAYDYAVYGGLEAVVKRIGHEKLARLYDFFDVAESTALEIVTAYVDLLRYRELLGFAEENLQQHQLLFKQVQERVRAGVGRGVDLEQATGRLALAQSNQMVEENNLQDVGARFLRLVGELPQKELAPPTDLSGEIVPADIETTLSQALQGSPGIHAAVERMRAASRTVDVREAAFLPRLELRAHHTTGSDRALLDGHSDESVVELALDYNLFRGNSDKATLLQFKRQLNQAKELLTKACRDVRQTTTIAFNDIKHFENQLYYLQIHHNSIANAREAYRNQFDIGQRTLLDLLDTQNEYFQSQRSYANASYDYLLTHARTLAEMGQLLTALDVRSANIPLPGELDSPHEGYDVEAICPAQTIPEILYSMGSEVPQSSITTGFVTPVNPDPDGDGVPTARDKCPGTPAATAVDADGCPKPDTVSAARIVTVPASEKTIDTVNVNFDTESSRIPKEILWKIAKLADTLKKHPGSSILLVVPADDTGTLEDNEVLSRKRVTRVRERLMFNHRIPPDRIAVSQVNTDRPTLAQVRIILQGGPTVTAP